ncbi:MAG: MBL fold metallo-hydrolase [Lachnospiraceae bacterium]
MGEIVVRLLGSRGTIPICGDKYKKYGGATSCVLIQLGGETILLDAGTGLLFIKEYLKESEKSIHILLSHPHLDHLQGMPICPICFEKDFNIAVYAVPHGELSAQQQIEALMCPPLWPVGVWAFTAEVSFHDIITSTFFIGKVKVEHIQGSHPGGCTLFRLSFNGKSIVYATDFEQDTDADQRLDAFAKGCDLFLCDGQYTQEEFLSRRGFGHSTWNFAAQMGARCGAKETKIIHHAVYRTDKELDHAMEEIRLSYPNCSFARSREEIVL